MILGLRTVKYPVTDLESGKAWYTRAFGVTPYFDEPFYVGFNIGGFELGLIPDGHPSPHGPVAYWGVDNIETEVERFVKELGSTVVEPIMDVGEGIKVAAVSDPFGNLVGMILNPHFDPKSVR